MNTIWQDLRFGLRTLGKRPGFTLIAVLTLALGIGATTAIFTVVNAVLLRPLPYPDAERLVYVGQQYKDALAGVGEPKFMFWREQSQSFDGLACYSGFGGASGNLSGGAEAEYVRGLRVSEDFFRVLGVMPLVGRTFSHAEDTPGGERVAILSHALWQRSFGGRRDLLGQRVLFNDQSVTVVGVMPPRFGFGEDVDLFIPMQARPTANYDPNAEVVGRLKPGVTLAQAQTAMSEIASRIEREHQASHAGTTVTLIPLQEQMVGQVKPILLLLLGAVGFVLLIVCANVANLLLVRASVRQKELAVRAALGAGRLRLLRQMLTESSLLALLGGGLGLLLAYGAVRALVALEPPNLPRLTQIGVDGRVLAFTFVTTLLVGALFGLAPALQASKPDVQQTLKEGFARGGGRRWLRRFVLRDALVVAQTALALVLLVGAGLLIRSFVKLQQVELGFEPVNTILLTLSPPFDLYPKDANKNDYYQRLLDELKAVPGVKVAAAATGGPTQGAYMSSALIVAGRPVPPQRDAQQTFINIVSPDYFRALGTPLRRGRLFSEADHAGAPRVVVINETLARAYFPNENPIGQRIALRGDPDELREIVGIVADINQFVACADNDDFRLADDGNSRFS
mgnify:CR=1 FL=1